MKEDIQALAEQAVKDSAEIPDFSYSGELDLGRTWAFTIAQTRDSDALVLSNFQTIWDDMFKRFPEDVENTRCSHWACGWVEYLTVRMLDSEGQVTEAGRAILKWRERLEDYPVADEEDFSRREHEDALSDVEWRAEHVDINKAPKNWAEEVFTWCWENEQGETQGGETPSKKTIQKALGALGWLEKEKE